MKINLLLLIIVSSFTLSTYGQGDIEVFGGFSRQQVETERFSEFSRYAGLTPSQLRSNLGATADQLNEGFKDTYRAARNINGINASLTYYFKGGLGLTGDFGYHSKEEDRSTPNNPIFFEDFSRSRRHSLTFTAGPQYKFNKTSKVQPFVRALFGVTRQKNRSSQFFNSIGNTNPGGTNQPFETTRLVDNYTAFTVGGGGGLDIKINKILAIRVVQVDYLMVIAPGRDASLTAPSIGGTSGIDLGQTSFDRSRRNNFRFSFGVVFRK